MSVEMARSDEQTSASHRSGEAASDARLSAMIAEKEKVIAALTKRAEKAERLLEKSNSYNEELQVQLTTVSAQLHEYRSLRKNAKTVSTQVSEESIQEAYGDKPMPNWESAGSKTDQSCSISESLKMVAEEIVQTHGLEDEQEEPEKPSSDYVYDAQTGYFYHPATGYYWDPISRLFYDYTSGAYYQYDEATGSYTFHSQVDLSSTAELGYQTAWPSNSNNIDLLSSELSSLSIDTQRYQKNALEFAENYPPCIRFIVQHSEHLPLGSLYIITCAGGTIGREPNMGHAIEIHDLNISKVHAHVYYDYDSNCYRITDKGSQNGTLLNYKRLSMSKHESQAHTLSHEDILEVGGTCLLLHIHSGNETCQDCEPGQVQARLKAENPVVNDHVVLTKAERNRQRIQELKQIKKKYGLKNSYFEHGGTCTPSGDDKAYLRRKYVGSEQPESSIISREAPASVQSPIASSNKGFKLLSKMGWKEGEGLGKTNTGIAEPINVEMRVDQSAGLGSAEGISLSLDNVHKSSKAKRWAQARQLYNKLEANEETAVEKPEVDDVTEQMSGAIMSMPNDKETPLNDSLDNPVIPSPSSDRLIKHPGKKSTSAPKISWVKGNTQQPTTTAPS